MTWNVVVAPSALRNPPSVIAPLDVVSPADNVRSTLNPRIGVVVPRVSVTGTLAVAFTVVTNPPGEPAFTVGVGSGAKLALIV